MNSIETAAYIIENNRHVVLSTVTEQGQPCVAPVFYAYDDSYDLFWVSAYDSQHSQNIRNNSRLAAVIFGTMPAGNVDAVYVQAQAHEVKDPVELEHAMGVLALRKQPDKFTIKSAADVSGDAIWRVYRAVATSMTKRSDSVHQPSSQAITVHQPIDLAVLRAH